MATRRKRITYSPTMERRAVLYARYSSTLQADSWSIEAQLADLRSYCDRMGWTVLADVCLDEAISGSTTERPGLERAMGLIREGKANVLVVHKLDRFFRDMARTFEYVRELEDHGAGLVCTQQPIDTTNPVSGKIVLAVMAALAEIYLDNLSEETAKGKKARAAAGLPNGNLPYGYKLTEPKSERGASNRAIAVIVPEEAEAVHQAFTWYCSGTLGDAQVARMLNDAGYSMRSRVHPVGYPFTKDTITPLLQNVFYAGWVVQPASDAVSSRFDRASKAPRVEGQHEAIISQEVLDRALDVRSRRRGRMEGRITHPRAGGRKAHHAAYLAAGLVRCAVCGHPLWAQGAEGRTPHYRCTWSLRGGKCATKRKSISASLLDEVLGAAISALSLTPDWREQVIAAADSLGEDESRLAARRLSIEQRLIRLRRLLIEGLIDGDEYRTERAALEADLATAAPSTGSLKLEQAAKLATNLSGLWNDANPEERKQLAAQTVTAMYCDTDHPEKMALQLDPVLHPVWDGLPHCTTWVTDGA